MGINENYWKVKPESMRIIDNPMKTTKCNENKITPLTIDDFRPIYEHICSQALGEVE